MGCEDLDSNSFLARYISESSSVFFHGGSSLSEYLQRSGRRDNLRTTHNSIGCGISLPELYEQHHNTKHKRPYHSHRTLRPRHRPLRLGRDSPSLHSHVILIFRNSETLPRLLRRVISCSRTTLQSMVRRGYTRGGLARLPRNLEHVSKLTYP